MKVKLNMILCIIWTIVAVISGMYAVMNGGALDADGGLADPNIQYIVASFIAPGALSVIFAFCSTIDDVLKLKNLAKDVLPGSSKETK